jgi:predicted PhzF superfamily epimerase YddE/YHI9
MKYRFQIVDVFSPTPFGGNQRIARVKTKGQDLLGESS